jgi:predicted anti-sigma-YlaC factor YlaD
MRLARSIEESCERVREQLSLALDGELSELDALRLQTHLRDCPDCSAFEAAMRAATTILRTAEPEEPIFPLMVPRRRRVQVRMLQAGAAAAAVALVAALSTLNDVSGQRSNTQLFRLSPTASLGHNDEVAPIRFVRVRPVHRVPL